eukprot:Skav232462  [mRNA]  locus=scaffold75:126900:128216:- [translate_table: standard]
MNVSLEFNVSLGDKSDNASAFDVQDEMENQSIAVNDSLAVNISEVALLEENETAVEKSDWLELDDNESSSVALEANISEENASNKTMTELDDDDDGMGTMDLNDTGNDSEAFMNVSLEFNVSLGDKSDNASAFDVQDEMENQSIAVNDSLAVNISEVPLLEENETAVEKSDWIELEENESSSIALDANISEENASNETMTELDDDGMDTKDLNDTGNDSEAFINVSLEFNVSLGDKSDNASAFDVQDEMENQSIAVNDSLAVNISEVPLLEENETAVDKSDWLELDDNESSSISLDANISEENASNETMTELDDGMDTMDLNDTGNDSEAFMNVSLEFNVSLGDKSENASAFDVQDEMENQSIAVNDSLAVNISEVPFLEENETTLDNRDENESVFAFDANMSEDNTSNKTEVWLLGIFASFFCWTMLVLHCTIDLYI